MGLAVFQLKYNIQSDTDIVDLSSFGLGWGGGLELRVLGGLGIHWGIESLWFSEFRVGLQLEVFRV